MGTGNRDGYTDSLDTLIVALCADFERRSHGSPDRRVAMEFKYLNTRMTEGAAEIVGHRLAEQMILEIGRRIGYASSMIEDISESTYKRKKQAVKRSIARKLYLM